jgi:outer membrane protein assembly factor BamB
VGKRRSIIIFGSITTGALALTACVGGPPSPEAVAAEFATPIEPVWQVDVPGLYGEPVIRDGVVLAYAVDSRVGMRLTAHAVDDGELLWEHTSSPGGAYANPILTAWDAASRAYPLPTIEPLVIETGEGEDAASAVVFFERDVETQTIRPDDFLRIADVRTGDLLDVTLPEIDPEEFTLDPLGFTDSGEIYANVYSPAYPCRDGQFCFVTTYADSSDGSGNGVVVLDPATLEARYEEPFIPETEETAIVEWGLEYLRVLGDDTDIARYREGEQLWRVTTTELFDDGRTSPPEFVDFETVGGVLLIQGYEGLLETLDPDLPHTVSIDMVEARTLVAVDPDSGEVLWRLPGGDMLCHAVRERPIAADADSIPICLASAGSFVYNLGTEEMDDQEEIVASIAELSVADGEVAWEVDGAGAVSIAHVSRLLDVTYAARGDLAVVDRAESEETGLVDLRDGKWYPAPAEDAGFVCKAERPDVELEFEGSTFAGGANPITTGYPAGWYHFACDDEGSETDVFTKGAVRVAGYPAGEKRVVLPLEGSLVAFDL